jgi:hypothetical protein
MLLVHCIETRKHFARDISPHVSVVIHNPGQPKRSWRTLFKATVVKYDIRHGHYQSSCLAPQCVVTNLGLELRWTRVCQQLPSDTNEYDVHDMMPAVDSCHWRRGRSSSYYNHVSDLCYSDNNEWHNAVFLGCSLTRALTHFEEVYLDRRPCPSTYQFYFAIDVLPEK